MSNHWLRLWHDMPNDPKWRTITRISGQPISLVQATYLHLLVDASRNVTRGHADVTLEDLASALDVTEDKIQAILDAMQGRVLDGLYLLGWEKRQPKREDAGDAQTGAKSPAERKRDQRAREKEADTSRNVTQCHAESREVTTDKDKDTDKEEIRRDISKPPKPTSLPFGFDAFWDAYDKKVGKPNAIREWKRIDPDETLLAKIVQQASLVAQTKEKQFRKDPERWLKHRGWEDEIILPSAPAVQVASESFAERTERLAREKFEQLTGRRTAPPGSNIIDITPVPVAVPALKEATS